MTQPSATVMPTLARAISDDLMKASRSCQECKARRLAKWPPSGMCEAHYRDYAMVDRANDDRRRYHASVLRDIARAALDEEVTRDD